MPIRPGVVDWGSVWGGSPSWQFQTRRVWVIDELLYHHTWLQAPRAFPGRAELFPRFGGSKTGRVSCMESLPDIVWKEPTFGFRDADVFRTYCSTAKSRVRRFLACGQPCALCFGFLAKHGHGSVVRRGTDLER